MFACMCTVIAMRCRLAARNTRRTRARCSGLSTSTSEFPKWSLRPVRRFASFAQRAISFIAYALSGLTLQIPIRRSGYFATWALVQLFSATTCAFSLGTRGLFGLEKLYATESTTARCIPTASSCAIRSLHRCLSPLERIWRLRLDCLSVGDSR
jgi:hypothetical protein